MSYSRKTIEKILSLENIGAGNYIYKLAEMGVDADRATIYLDKAPFHQPDKLELSINDVVRLASRYSVYFKNNGIQPKDTVAIFLDDGIEYFILYVALTAIGAIPVFINSDLDADIVGKYIDYVNVVAIVLDDSRWKKMHHAGDWLDYKCKVFKLENIRLQSYEPNAFKLFKHTNEDPVLLAHTSGTTGVPKAVRFNHASLFYGFSKQLYTQVGERVISALPHSHGSSLGILMSIFLKGVEVLVQTQKTPEALFSAIERFKPDLFASFPQIYVEMCRHDLSLYDLDSIQYWLSTGDANHESHIRKLISHGCHYLAGEKHKGSLFIDNLGSTEFAYAVFVNVHNPYSDNYNRCVGRPLTWAEVAVLSDEGEPLLDYQIGKLGVKANSVTPGYWNNSLLTEKSRLGEYWLLGDLVYRGDNNVYYHVDRIQDSISTGEKQFYSCQIEELILSKTPEIFDCSLVCAQDQSGEDRLFLTVDLFEGDKVSKELEQRINALLQEKGIPELYRIVAEPAYKNTGVTGKKLKRKLREQLVEKFV